jgi:ATP-dependent exoDNAse (exonuclease V) beta subunit
LHDVNRIARLAASGSALSAADHGATRAAIDSIRDHFLTRAGKPRERMPGGYAPDHYAAPASRKRHLQGVRGLAPAVAEALAGYRRDLNVVMSRGLRRLFDIALAQYRRTLEDHAVLDFSELLARALALLAEMDEFAQSRYRLEARYHHVLVDEFQDTSRAQWRLVSLLVRSWGEGLGVPHESGLPPSIFIVGDRKQSIYRFRDAEVRVLDEAAREIEALRQGERPRRAISHSFRSAPALLAFTNDLFGAVEHSPARGDGFRFESIDRFPVDASHEAGPEDIGLVVAPTEKQCAGLIAAEIDRLLLGETTVRDRQAGVRRPVRPGDIAVLFRSRASHHQIEDALAERQIPTYVYRGLGFFESDEIKDVVALLRFLADSQSDLRAAALLRSRFVRLSDAGLAAIGPSAASALVSPSPPRVLDRLEEEDRRVLGTARAHLPRWLELADRVPAAELIDRVLAEAAYAIELSGPRASAARENLKKLRGLVRRIQNSGYATLGRITGHLDRLSAGDESNAVVDATDAVNLMTVHAAKGLEFPVIFIANVGRGTGARRETVRVYAGGADGDPSVAIGDFESEGDEDMRATDREETKRLLYVAITRARDRLYLASVMRSDSPRPARGSLAEVLPADVLGAFAAASHAPPEQETVAWATSSGRRHTFRVCRQLSERHGAADSPAVGTADSRAAGTADSPAAGTASPVLPQAAIRLTDFPPIVAAPPVRLSVTRFVAPPSPDVAAGKRYGSRASVERLAGAVAHRLIRAGALEWDESGAAKEAGRLARTLLAEGERATAADPDELARLAVQAVASFRGQPAVRELLGSGRCLYEVPFSLMVEEGSTAQGPVCLRGAIDCIVLHSDSAATVVEFKTGAPHPEHRAQLDLYVRAARAFLPGMAVEGLLVFARTGSAAASTAGGC